MPPVAPSLSTSPPAPSSGAASVSLTSTEIFERNLQALALRNPDTARRLANAPALATTLAFTNTDDGVPAATLSAGNTAQSLCSRRRPLDEARKLIDAVDIKSAAVFVVAGFGLGYHVLELARRVGKTGLIVVFEPDLALLRAVFEKVDCSHWLSDRSLNIAILTDPDDSAEMSRLLHGMEGIVALGVQLVEHPASKARLAALGDAVDRFHEQFVTLVKGVKLTIVTTLVQIRTTLRNLSQNIDHYLVQPGIDDLRDRFAGRPAIVVSAGPSLARNIDLLTKPGIRDRFVIVAVQTVLKTLLAKGIRPHFVTALDYSDISARFYEGLTPTDVDGITLVVEPKVNPAVLDAFPRAKDSNSPGGGVRCTGDRFIEQLLTPEHSPPHAFITPGSTVAHLAYYFARFLGCDPVALIGQDLAFTDGQYYAAHAAIHRTWACELNEFQTLESFEWQRIARMGPRLHRATDHLDRPVFTDEQMNSYRLQFERDFMADDTAGLRTFDCTEGGVKKLYATPKSLADFIREFDDPRAAPITIPAAHPCPANVAQTRLKAVFRHLKDVRGKSRRVGELSRQAADLLTQMREHLADVERVNRLIDKTQVLRKQVEDLEPAYGMVHLVNQKGTLNRLRADRILQLEKDLDIAEIQRREIDRDSNNVRFLASAADELCALLDHAIAALPEDVGGQSAPKLTQDPPSFTSAVAEPTDSPAAPTVASRVCAVIPFDHLTAPLGTPRTGPLDPHRALMGTMPPLRITIERLARSNRLSAIVIAAADPAIAQSLVPATVNGKPVEFIELTPADRAPTSTAILAAARLFAPDAWRSAPGGFTCYDEAFVPHSSLAALDHTGCDAALVVGPDWCLVDPTLCDEVIDRHQSNPTSNRLAFTQAPPGLCGALVHRSLLHDTLRLRSMPEATTTTAANKFSCIGGMLGYVPSSPATDLIAYPVCTTIPAALRDHASRITFDRAHNDDDAILPPLGHAALDADHHAILRACHTAPRTSNSSSHPTHLTLQIAALRATRSIYADANAIIAHVRAAVQACPDLAVTLIGSRLHSADLRADPLNHPDIFNLLLALRDPAHPIGALHLRTSLLTERANITTLLSLPESIRPHILSVDLPGESAHAYRAVTGHDTYGEARANLEHLLTTRQRLASAANAANPNSHEWLRAPLIAVRLIRCDATYAEVETFYNRWMSLADWAVLDPHPAPKPTDRIQPLPLPDFAQAHLDRTHRTISIDDLLA